MTRLNAKRLALALLAFVVVWFVGDFGYFCFTGWKHRQWEATVERDENGVLQGCEAFSMGQGATAILLLHGINDTPFTYRSMAKKLADSQFGDGETLHVRAMRMPGFGEPVPTYASKTAHDWTDAIKREFNSLKKTHSRVFIVAHSLGGAVTIQAIIQEARKPTPFFDGVILLAPAIDVSNERSPILPTRWWHRISSGLVFTQFTHSPFPPDTRDPELVDFPNRTPFTPRSIINETFSLIDANRGQEKEFTIPLLLVLSDQDEVIDYEAAERWFERVASERKELYWNHQGGHQLQYDLGWKDITRKIVEFVEETPLADQLPQ